ncbi:MAG: hypothetical protein ACLP2J_10395 [Acidimicrobiales bacterium]
MHIVDVGQEMAVKLDVVPDTTPVTDHDPPVSVTVSSPPPVPTTTHIVGVPQLAAAADPMLVPVPETDVHVDPVPAAAFVETATE